jgi:hypothetical protein
MKVINNIEQGSAEWHALRIGRITSSRTKDIMKSDNLPVVDALIAERECRDEALWDAVENNYESDAMRWGTEHEPEAKQKYSEQTGIELIDVAFCIHDVYDWLGMSPDGLTPDYTGAVEVKCPATKTHVRTIRMGGVPNEHKHQIAQYFLVNEKLQWLDFISYDPRFAPKPLYIYRVEREHILTELSDTMTALVKFWAKFEKYHQQVTF